MFKIIREFISILLLYEKAEHLTLFSLLKKELISMVAMLIWLCFGSIRFAAALIDRPLRVMNVVQIGEPDTLPVILKRC
jgi:hypothetical protein